MDEKFRMRRELSFAKFGRVVIVLSVLFYAGFINPIAQAWCDAQCPHSSPPELLQSASTHCPHDTMHSEGTNDLCCHAPDFTDTHSMSHLSLQWAPLVMPSAMILSEDRFEISALQLRTDEPDMNLDSPPPKSILVS